MTLDFVEFGVHVGAKIGKSGVHVGAEVHKFAIDDCELADDLAKVGVDLDSHVVKILLCCWLVHGVTVVISHGRTDGNKSEIVGGMGRSVTQDVL